MVKLGLLDQLFYQLEQAGTSIYMQGALVLDASEAEPSLDGDTLAEHLMARLRGIPLLGEKVVRDPLGVGSIQRVEDPDFDVREHVGRFTLSPPGDEETLLAHLEASSVERLDLSKPLWRFEVIDGLADGRLVIFTRLHHSFIDGVGSTQMLGSLYDTERRPPERLGRARRRRKPREPTALELTQRALGEVAFRVVATPRFLGRNAGALLRAVEGVVRDRLIPGEDAEGTPRPIKTSLNTSLSRDRRVVAFRRFEIDEVKALTRTLGCTVNDVAFLLCSAALERYFAEIGEPLESDLLAWMPVDVRAKDGSADGNRVGVATVNLHTRIPRLTDRLREIQRDAGALKEQVRAENYAGLSLEGIGLDEIQEVLPPLLVDAMAALFPRLVSWDAVARQLVMANATISNVPGPRQPLYVAGALVEYSIPMIPIADNMTLSWGVTSFGRWLTIGFHGCGEAIRDKELLIQGLDKAWAELRACAAEPGARTIVRGIPASRTGPEPE